MSESILLESVNLFYFSTSTEVVYLQRGMWCHAELLAFRRTFCVYHTPMLQCHFIRSHIRRMYVCLAVTCHLHVWQNDQALLRATAVIQGVEQTFVGQLLDGQLHFDTVTG